MKKSFFKTSLILAILFLMMPGCLNIWFTTDIHPDGSIGKTIVIEGDSAEIVDVHLALMNEPGWKKEWTKIEGDKNNPNGSTEDNKDKFKLTLSREFKSVQELNKSMNPADTNVFTIRTNSTLHRKFRWFFTRFVYEETILNANPFKKLNYHDFLSEEEVRLICMTDEAREADPKYDSVIYKQTDKRYEEYLFRSMYEDFYERLLPILNEDKSLTLTVQELDNKKETIYHFLIDSTKGDSPEAILDGFGKVLQNPAIEVIKSKYINRFDGFSRKLAFYLESSDDSYKFNIRMPGLLLSTNSNKIEGSATNWEVTFDDFFFRDYTMTAESRMVNTWAFILAGLILLAAMAGLYSVARRKR